MACGGRGFLGLLLPPALLAVRSPQAMMEPAGRPFVGAATFLVLEDRLSVFTESWPLFIGLIFMAFVLFLPKGIWGTLLARLR